MLPQPPPQEKGKKKKKTKNLGKVPIQQKKKSTSQYHWKSYESTLMLDFN